MDLGRSLVGERLGHFQLEEFVGGGGMGAVFRATDTMLGRTVAVKVVSRDDADEEMLRRFRNEAQSAARLDHPHIARVYYVGDDRGWNYIVFEFIEGVNVRDLVMHKGPLPVAEAISYTCQVAEALEHAAERDVVHRDIKPSNILVMPDGRAKLVDMGLARLHQVDAPTQDLTATGVTLGTFDYISPEQARDPRSADVRSDMYSLGCTLYFMLTGMPPFPEGTVLQKLLSHSSDPPPDPRELRADLDDDLCSITLRLMAKQPGHRFQTPTELIDALYLLSDRLGLPHAQRRSVLTVASELTGVSRLTYHLPWIVPLVLLFAAVFGAEWLLPTTGTLSGRTVSNPPRNPITPPVTGPNSTNPTVPTESSKVSTEGQPPATSESSSDDSSNRTTNKNSDLPDKKSDSEGSSKSGNPLTTLPDSPSNSNPGNPNPGNSGLGNPGFGNSITSKSPVGNSELSPPESVSAPNPTDIKTNANDGQRETSPSSTNGANSTAASSARELPGRDSGSREPSSQDTASTAVRNDSDSTEPASAATVPAARNDVPLPVRNPRLLVVSPDEVPSDDPTLCGSLGAALQKVAVTPEVDTIELRFPYRLEKPLTIAAREENSELTIKGSAGYAPLIQFRPSPSNLLGDRSMLRLVGGKVNFVGIHFRMDLTQLLGDEWSLFHLRQVKSVTFRDCTFTVVNDVGTQVAVFYVEGPPRSRMMSDGMPPMGMRLQRPTIELASCVVRGHANLVRSIEGLPFRLHWAQGFLATSAPAVYVRGLRETGGAEVIDVSMRRVTASLRSQLCFVDVEKNAPLVPKLTIDTNECVFDTHDESVPLVEHRGVDNLDVLMRNLYTQTGGRNRYSPVFQILWRVRTWESEQRDLLWGADGDWYKEQLSEKYTPWRNTMRTDNEPLHRYVPSDFRLIEDEASMAGFDESQIPIPVEPPPERSDVD